jgi:hypothetical protein
LTLARQTGLDRVIEDYNAEIDAEQTAIDLKKNLRDQLVTRRDVMKKEAKVDNESTANDNKNG